MVNKPITLQPGESAPTVAASIRHSSIAETSETKPLINTDTITNTRSCIMIMWLITLMYLYRSSDSSDITSFEVRDVTVLQRRLSTVVETETPFKYDMMTIKIVNKCIINL